MEIRAPILHHFLRRLDERIAARPMSPISHEGSVRPEPFKAQANAQKGMGPPTLATLMGSFILVSVHRLRRPQASLRLLAHAGNRSSAAAKDLGELSHGHVMGEQAVVWLGNVIAMPRMDALNPPSHCGTAKNHRAITVGPLWPD